MKLTKNFTLSEATNWINRLGYTPTTRAWYEKLAQDQLNKPEILSNIQAIAKHLQEVRDQINEKWPEYKGGLRIQTTSWLRPLEWEKMRKRSGLSQHTQGHAVDFIVVNPKLKPAQRNEIMEWIFEQHKDFKGGLAFKKSGDNWSFIHIDLRGRKARWEY